MTQATKHPATRDYSLTMKDGSGRTVILYINGDSVDESIAAGGSREDVQDSAFANAIERGEIGADAWLV